MSHDAWLKDYREKQKQKEEEEWTRKLATWHICSWLRRHVDPHGNHTLSGSIVEHFSNGIGIYRRDGNRFKCVNIVESDDGFVIKIFNFNSREEKYPCKRGIEIRYNDGDLPSILDVEHRSPAVCISEPLMKEAIRSCAEGCVEYDD